MTLLHTLDISSNAALGGSIPAQWSAMGSRVVSTNQTRRVVQLTLSYTTISGYTPSSFARINHAAPQLCVNLFHTLVRLKFASRNDWNCDWTASRSATPTTSFTADAPAVIEVSSPPTVTVKSVAQVSSGVGAVLTVFAAAPSSGFAVDRLTTLSGFGDCSDAARQTVQNLMTNGVPTFLDAPLQLSFGDEFGASQRGTVLGNLLVFIIVGIVSLGAVAVHQCGVGWNWHTASTHSQKTLLVQSAAALRLPGALIVIVVLLLDSLVASSVLLVGYGTYAHDALLGAIGLLLVSALFLGTCFVLDLRPLSFQACALTVLPITVSDELLSTNDLPTQVAAWWDRIKTPCNRWEPQTLHKGNSLFVEHFGHLFEGCCGGRHWWILVEAFTTIVLSTLSSVVPNTESECIARAWIALALMSAMLVAFVASRPMNTPIETGTAILLLCAQVVVVACAIGGVGNVADIIGLSVSISSATVALLPIAWWFVSLARSHWDCHGKKAPRDLLLDMRTQHLTLSAERPPNLSKMLRRSTSIPSAMSWRWKNEEHTSSDTLRVIIELICDTRCSK